MTLADALSFTFLHYLSISLIVVFFFSFFPLDVFPSICSIPLSLASNKIAAPYHSSRIIYAVCLLARNHLNLND